MEELHLDVVELLQREPRAQLREVDVLVALVLERATLKQSVEVGLQIAVKLTDLVGQLKEFRGA